MKLLKFMSINIKHYPKDQSKFALFLNDFFFYVFFFSLLSFVYFLFVCLFAFPRAAPAAYGGSQARGRIGAAAASPCHSQSIASSDPHL